MVMKAILWIIAGLVVPFVVYLEDGSQYAVSIGAVVLGAVLYVTNVMLINLFARLRAPGLFNDRDIDSTAGRGIVPKWVSVMGLFAMGLVPGGMLKAAAIYFGWA